MNEHLIPKACFAHPNACLCTPEDFLKKAGNDYKNKGLFPYCPECDEKLILVNPSNILKSTFYKHYDLNVSIDGESIEICSLRSKNLQGKVGSALNLILSVVNTLRKPFGNQVICVTLIVFVGVCVEGEIYLLHSSVKC